MHAQKITIDDLDSSLKYVLNCILSYGDAPTFTHRKIYFEIPAALPYIENTTTDALAHPHYMYY